jgi:type I restriction enzyme R subunit
MEELRPGDLNDLLKEVNHRIERNNLLNSTDHSDDVTGIIREVISQIEFEFRKKGQEELEIIYNDLKERYEDVKREFDANFDKQKDPVYVSLADEFKKYFRKRGFQLQNVVQAKEEIGYMDSVMERIRAINRANNMLKRKYNDDESFARIHKRIREENDKRLQRTPKEKPIISENERELAEELSRMKAAIDAQIYANIHILGNEEHFSQDVLRDVSLTLVAQGITAPVTDRKVIRKEIVNEYMARYAPRMAVNF